MISGAYADRVGTTDRDGFHRLSPFQLATGWVGGFDHVDLPTVDPSRSPRQYFEDALLRALTRPPCVIAFSGGRDSSALLAVAMNLARREHLPEPVAATHDFRGCGAADEREWQELVIRHLGVADWCKVTDVDAFDVLGGRAQKGLRRFGVLFPALVHCHEPLMELALGGSLVVGEGGDELLGLQRMTPIASMIRRRRPPKLGLLPMLVRSLAPRPARRALCRREVSSSDLHPWLPVELQVAHLEQDAKDFADAPLRWDDAIRRQVGRRSGRVGLSNVAAVCRASDVAFSHPFLDPHFVESWAVTGGRIGRVSRTGMMRELFGDVLPDEVCRRDSKAHFGGVAVGGPSADFLREWNGEGVDTSVIDLDALRRACAETDPVFGTQLLLQTGWLALHGRDRPADREPVSAPDAIAS